MSPKRRIFIARNRLPNTPVLIIAVILMTLVTACAPEMSSWSPEQSVKRNDVRWITFHHQVMFENSSAELSDAERARLHQFLDRKSVV